MANTRAVCGTFLRFGLGSTAHKPIIGGKPARAVTKGPGVTRKPRNLLRSPPCADGIHCRRVRCIRLSGAAVPKADRDGPMGRRTCDSHPSSGLWRTGWSMLPKCPRKLPGRLHPTTSRISHPRITRGDAALYLGEHRAAAPVRARVRQSHRTPLDPSGCERVDQRLPSPRPAPSLL